MESRDKIINIIQKMYDGFTSQVIQGRTLSEPFPVTTEVRQGCLLYLLLFLLVIEWVGRTAYSSPTGIQRTLTSRLEDLDFADGICTRLQDSKQQPTYLETTDKRTGLYINSKKTTKNEN